MAAARAAGAAHHPRGMALASYREQAATNGALLARLVSNRGTRRVASKINRAAAK